MKQDTTSAVRNTEQSALNKQNSNYRANVTRSPQQSIAISIFAAIGLMSVLVIAAMLVEVIIHVIR